MKFHYYLESSTGWAIISFEHDSFRRNYSIEYCIGDNLFELLEGILALIGYRKESKLGSDIEIRFMDNDEDVFEWITSQGNFEAKFAFKLIDDSNINLKITEITKTDDNDEIEIVFDNTINKSQLIDNILVSCEEILDKYGIIGYYQNFWTEFPTFYYLLLKDHKNGKLKIDDFRETIDNHEETMFRSNLEDELAYLKS
jgi:hypothetical protein